MALSRDEIEAISKNAANEIAAPLHEKVNKIDRSQTRIEQKMEDLGERFERSENQSIALQEAIVERGDAFAKELSKLDKRVSLHSWAWRALWGLLGVIGAAVVWLTSFWKR